jgi:low temperature requirement protein LtrA
VQAFRVSSPEDSSSTVVGVRRRVWPGPPRPTPEAHSATTFELFFDLVYVFAATQVTHYIAHEHTANGFLQGMLLLALLWWTWSAYTWLGNQARADEGLVQLGMFGAMACIFVVALVIPEAWHDAPGGLNGPLVLVASYVLVRVIHLTVYTVAATAAEDAGLHRQLAITWGPMLAGSALLFIGVALGERWQTAFFAAAVILDWLGTWLTSRHGNWRLRSPSHYTERHGLFVMLAIGESIVAIGVGAAQLPISTTLIVGAVLGITLSVCLWWLYFDAVAMAAEHVLGDTPESDRARLAVEAYTYGHFPIVAGVITAAVGVESVLAHAQESEGLGGFGAATLYGGLALYLVGHVMFKWRMLGQVSRYRVGAAVVLVIGAVLGAGLAPLAALAAAVLVVGALVMAETLRYADERDAIRHATEVSP